MNTTWSKTEIKILRQNSSCSLDRLSELIVTKSKAAIATKRRRMSLHTRHSFEWTPAQRKRLKKLWPTASWKEIEKEFSPVSRHAIGEMARRLGSNREIEPQRKGNLQPLLENTPEAWYWIGFIAADGWISEGGQVVVTISEKDRDHLEKFAKFLQTKVGDGGTTKGKWGKFKMIRVAVQDHVLGQQIKHKYGFKANKTEQPPDLSWINTEDKFFSFWAGFIDGDGSIFCSQDGYLRVSVECHFGWHDCLLGFEKRLLRTLNVTADFDYTKISKSGRCAKVSLARAEIVCGLWEKVRKLNLPLMNRKWRIFHERA